MLLFSLVMILGHGEVSDPIIWIYLRQEYTVTDWYFTGDVVLLQELWSNM